MQFYEELVDGEHSSVKELPSKPINKKITFADSDSSSSEDDDDDDDDAAEAEERHEGDEEKAEKKPKLDTVNDDKVGLDGGTGGESDPCKVDEPPTQALDKHSEGKGDIDNLKTTEAAADELPAVKQCSKTNVEEKSIDKLIEEEFKELGDKNKVT